MTFSRFRFAQPLLILCPRPGVSLSIVPKNMSLQPVSRRCEGQPSLRHLRLSDPRSVCHRREGFLGYRFTKDA